MNSEHSLTGPRRNGAPAGLPVSHETTRLICLEPLENEGAQKTGSNGMLELWQMARDRKLPIAVVAVLGVVAALVVSMFQTPIYQARTTIEIQSLNEGSVEPFGGETGGGYTPESYLATQARILQSASLRQRVEQKVAQEYHPGPKPLDRFAAARKALHFPAPNVPGGRKLPPVKVDVRPFENTRLIEVLAEAPDPVLAAQFANTMTNEYVESHLEARWNSAQRTTQWLTLQLEKLKLKLQDSENRLQTYSRATGLVITDDKTNVEQAKLAQIQAELTRAQADRVIHQSGYEIAATAPADSVPQVLDNGRLSAYQAQITDLRRQAAELSASLTPEHYKVVRLQAQIRELETALRRERDNIMMRIRNEYQSAVRRESALSAVYSAQARLVNEQAGKSVNYDIMRREVDSNRKLYDALLEKVQGAGLASAMRVAPIRVVDPAEPPTQPYKPNLFQNVALGLATGLLLGVAFVFAGEQINRSLKSPGETPFHLKVPELGVIPEKDCVTDHGPRDAAQRLIPLRTALNGSADHVELVTWQDRPSMLAESFRSTLASILVAEQNGQQPRVILVTSANRGEGKSSTVSNLGIALAEINQKVLLLDADMRKPHLHQVFNTPNSWGLSDLLRERTSLKDMPLEALARETEIKGLYILPSGTGTVSIANLLYSNRTAELIERLRGEFDMVLIDTPPMLYLSDARVLGRLADGAILVVRAGRTTRDAALGAKQRLVDDRIPVLGTILNGWDPKSKTRYGYYAYPAGPMEEES